jgi:scyllo-inositol 2-dehydrogenase (NADP+)
LKEQGCRVFTTLEDALNDPAVELICIVTPNSTHADIAVKAMKAGKNVVTDKVMALTLDECDRMITTAHENNVMLSVFQNRRLDGDFITVQKLISDGKLGDVVWAEMAWQTFGIWGGWRGKREMGGGKMFDLGAHLIDQLCLLFPADIKSVYCRMQYDSKDYNVESEAFTIITFADGKTAICDLSSMAAIQKPRFYIRGTKGTFSKYGLDPQEQWMLAGDINASMEEPKTYGKLNDGKHEHKITTIPGRWRSYYENIADVLLNGAESLVKLPELRRQISVIDACFKSAASGEVISF